MGTAQVGFDGSPPIQTLTATLIDGYRTGTGAPSAGLELEWVYGYRSLGVRNAVQYVGGEALERGGGNDTLAYPAAGVAVVLDTDRLEQRFCAAHDDEIVSHRICPLTSCRIRGQFRCTV